MPRDIESRADELSTIVNSIADGLPHIFERFYRTGKARKGGGLGLGLYITRLLVEANGGRICVESRPGKGSTFIFTLPIYKETE